MENMEFKVATSRTLASFLCGLSTTANEKVLGQYKIQALKYLVDHGIISLDMSNAHLEGLNEDDKAGRYRFNESHRVKAEKLKTRFQVEIAKIERTIRRDKNRKRNG